MLGESDLPSSELSQSNICNTKFHGQQSTSFQPLVPRGGKGGLKRFNTPITAPLDSGGAEKGV